MEENGRVRVFVRLRPPSPTEESSSSSIDLQVHETALHLQEDKTRVDKWYTFDKVFSPKASNREVYLATGKPLINAALNGYNGTLFGYGQTSSGKTHTLMAHDGITANLVEGLFRQIVKNSDFDYKVSCSYIQVYKERIYDLLNSNPKIDLFVREDSEKGIIVENISYYMCHSPADVVELLRIGRRRLIFAETRMNRQSSRSHAVFQISVERSKTKKTQSKVVSNENGMKCSSPTNSPSHIDSKRRPLPRQREKDPSSLQSLRKPSDTLSNLPGSRRPRPKSFVLPSRSNALSTSRPQPRRPVDSPTSAASTIAQGISTPNLLARLTTPGAAPVTSLGVQDTRIPRRQSLTSPFKLIKTTITEDSSDLGPTAVVSEHPKTNGRSRTPDVISLHLSRETMRCDSSLSLKSTDMDDSMLLEDMEWQLAATGPDSSQIDSNSDISRLLDDEDDGSVENMASLVSNEDVVLHGKINIVDLAGSERIKKTQAEGDRLQEAQNINLSLLELGNVVSALAEGSQHVPYRNSVLTRLLQDSLGGNCKTSFVLCVSTCQKDFSETKCTLDFGQRALKVATKPRINMEVDYKRLSEELQARLENQVLENEKISKSFSERTADLEAKIKELQSILEFKESKEMMQKIDCEAYIQRIKELELENDRLRARRSLCNQSTNTEPLTGKMYESLTDKDKLPGEIERLRSVLLTEIMSLQLLHTMFDLANNPENDHVRPGNHEGGPRVETCHPPSVSSSGYGTAAPSQVNSTNSSLIEEDRSKFYTQNRHHFLFSEESFYCSPLLSKLREPYSPRKCGLLEEIMEAQFSGAVEITGSPVTNLPVADKVRLLRKEIYMQKKTVDHELICHLERILPQLSEMKRSGGRINKRKVLSELLQHLSDPVISSRYSLDDYEQILNLILVDHSLTSCLLALAHRRSEKGSCEMRRLSNFLSPKSLLEFIDVDEDLSGYDNEAVVFGDGDEEGMQNQPVDPLANFCLAEDLQGSDLDARNVPQIQDDGCQDVGNSDNEEALPKKKFGIRRFLCMPRRSFRRKSYRKKKEKETQLIANE